MKRKLLAIAALAAISHAPASLATNWFELQNTEAPGAPAYTIWGFIQPQFQHNTGGTVNNLAGQPGITKYNGQVPAFNLVGPDLTSKDQAQIFRARPGVRGAVADGHIDYFLLAELGNNGITENGFSNGAYNKRTAVLSDATVTFNYIPGARVRVGLGRLPLGEEAMLGEPAMDYINFTGVTDGLLNERFLAPTHLAQTQMAYLPGEVMNGGLSQSAALTGSVGAFRDTGVEVFDWFNQDKWEYAYALMVSQADGLNLDTANNPGNHDVTGRLQASYVFGGSGPKRRDITAFVWHQDGQRHFNGINYDRMREGIGAKYWDGKLRVSGEYIQGTGMIYVGPYPGFGSNYVPGAFVITQLMAMGSFNKANGYYLDTGWKFTDKIEGDLRYDYYDKLSNSAPDERKNETWTVGGQYFYSKSTRFVLNYAYRKATANPGTSTQAARVTGEPTGAPAVALQNAINALATTGNVLSLQMTYLF